MELIAHRGASAYAPENTQVAFRIALEMGARAIELDIRETSDVRMLVIHDDTFKRTAGLRAAVAETPYTEAARLDAGSWFDHRFAGERLPLLESVLELAKGKAEMHVEIKSGKPGLEKRLLDLLKRTGFMKEAVVSSFHPHFLKKLRELDKTVRLGLLVGGGPLSLPAKAVAEAKGLRCESVHISLNQANAKWLRAIKDHGMQALVYTVNKVEDVSRLEKLGFDAVFTNYPDLVSSHWNAVGGSGN